MVAQHSGVQRSSCNSGQGVAGPPALRSEQHVMGPGTATCGRCLSTTGRVSARVLTTYLLFGSAASVAEGSSAYTKAILEDVKDRFLFSRARRSPAVESFSAHHRGTEVRFEVPI